MTSSQLMGLVGGIVGLIGGGYAAYCSSCSDPGPQSRRSVVNFSFGILILIALYGFGLWVTPMEQRWILTLIYGLALCASVFHSVRASKRLWDREHSPNGT